VSFKISRYNKSQHYRRCAAWTVKSCAFSSPCAWRYVAKNVKRRKRRGLGQLSATLQAAPYIGVTRQNE